MKDNTFLSCLGVTVLAIASIVVGAVMNGYVLSVLWGWFVVPIFHAPSLSIATAIGLSLAVGMIVKQGSSSSSNNKDKGIGYVIVEIVAAVIVAPLFTLFVGWIVKFFV